MKVYLLSGKDVFRQEERLASLLKEFAVEKENTVMMDASNPKTFRLEEAIMNCDMFSLFDDTAKKAVIIKEPFFLNAASKASKKSEAEKENRLKVLEAYLAAPNPNTLLIFYCHIFDADTRKKEYKLLTAYGATVIKFELMKSWDFEKYVDNILKKEHYFLEQSAKKELLSRVDNDTLRFHNAMVKLDLFGKHELTLQDIKHIVPVNPELNVFRMSNAFVVHRTADVLVAMDEMLQANYDYVAMIAMLSGRLRYLYNIKKLYERGLSDAMISTRLHTNEWAVKKGIENCRYLKSKQLLRYLYELAVVDQGIKSGKMDAKSGFEQFILRNGS